MFAPFGPQGDQAGEAGAALLVLAARHEAAFARALPEDYKPGGLSELCQPTIDGYAAEKSGMDNDMVQHLVNLLGTATSSTTGEQHQAAWPVRPPAARAATWRPPRQSAGACRRRFQVHARENRRQNIQGRGLSASQRFDRA